MQYEPDFQNESTVESIEITAGDAVAVTPAPTAATVPEPTAASITVMTKAPVTPPLGDAFESPPDLEWELDEETGVFSGEIELGVVTMDNFWGETVTRGFNGQVCSARF